jgi:hypothetical protein
MARRGWLMRFNAEGDFQSPGACLVEELSRHCRVDVLGVADFWTLEHGWVLTVTLEGAEPPLP